MDTGPGPTQRSTQIGQAVYAMLPRSADARDPLVISFGVIQGGINPNVIPESVQLRGTIRSADSESSQAAKRRLREIVDGVAQSCQVKAQVSIAYSLPSVHNDEHLVRICREAILGVVGEEGLVYVDKPSMGGEDFAWYLHEVPGLMLRLGVGTPLRRIRHLHSSCFDINESSLPIGTRTLARCVCRMAWAHQSQSDKS